jgi:hypothetical protein
VERVDYESMLVQDLLNAHARGELDVSPWYQRRSVWSTAHKAYLINSIFTKMPVPTIYLRHTLDLEREMTVKEVVDGQQRTRSILEYRNDEFTARHPDHSRRVRYSELSAMQREKFLMAKLPTAQLIGADDADVIEIFGRLNAVSKTLNAQEKRAAQYSGEFHQFCLKQSVRHLPIWRDRNIFSATAISRMSEVQFIADLSLSMVHGIQDFSALRITGAYKKWDEDFPERDALGARFERVFNYIADMKIEAIRDTIFSRSPLFYSLILVLDSLDKLPSPRATEERLSEIDVLFTDPGPVTSRREALVACIGASTATTQRIRQRKIRDEFIRSFFE